MAEPVIESAPRFAPGDHLDWPALLRAPPADLVLGHDMGHAIAPDSPGGRWRLELRPDGALALGWWRGAAHRAWTARGDPQIFADFAGILAAVGFPAVPDHPIFPGASVRVVDARTGGLGVSALLAVHFLEHEPPYDRLFLLADTLVYRVSDHPVPPWKALLDVAVTERRER